MSDPLKPAMIWKVPCWRCDECDKGFGREGRMWCPDCKQNFCLRCEMPSLLEKNKYGNKEWICHECVSKRSRLLEELGDQVEDTDWDYIIERQKNE